MRYLFLSEDILSMKEGFYIWVRGQIELNVSMVEERREG